jgi:hypothetical protein
VLATVLVTVVVVVKVTLSVAVGVMVLQSFELAMHDHNSQPEARAAEVRTL